MCVCVFPACFGLPTEEGKIRKKGKTKPAAQTLLAAPVNVLTENEIVDFERLGSAKRCLHFLGVSVTPHSHETLQLTLLLSSPQLGPHGSFPVSTCWLIFTTYDIFFHQSHQPTPQPGEDSVICWLEGSSISSPPKEPAPWMCIFLFSRVQCPPSPKAWAQSQKGWASSSKSH